MAPVPVLVSNIQGPSPRGYHSAALSLEAGEKAIYVFGGQCCIGGPYEYYNDVYRFNLETNHWEFIDTYDEPLNGKPQRPHPRSQSFIFVKNGYLYVYGGYDGHNIFADMYRLEISTRTWTLIWASKYSEGLCVSCSSVYNPDSKQIEFFKRYKITRICLLLYRLWTFSSRCRWPSSCRF